MSGCPFISPGLCCEDQPPGDGNQDLFCYTNANGHRSSQRYFPRTTSYNTLQDRNDGEQLESNWGILRPKPSQRTIQSSLAGWQGSLVAAFERLNPIFIDPIDVPWQFRGTAVDPTSGWQYTSNNFALRADGMPSNVNPKSGTGIAYVDFEVPDQVVTATVLVNANQVSGVIFRMTDSNDYLCAFVDRILYRIVIFDGIGGTVLASENVPTAFLFGATIKIDVTAVGQDIQATFSQAPFGGFPSRTLTATTAKTGTLVGYYSYSDTSSNNVSGLDLTSISRQFRVSGPTAVNYLAVYDVSNETQVHQYAINDPAWVEQDFSSSVFGVGNSVAVGAYIITGTVAPKYRLLHADGTLTKYGGGIQPTPYSSGGTTPILFNDFECGFKARPITNSRWSWPACAGVIVDSVGVYFYHPGFIGTGVPSRSFIEGNCKIVVGNFTTDGDNAPYVDGSEVLSFTVAGSTSGPPNVPSPNEFVQRFLVNPQQQFSAFPISFNGLPSLSSYSLSWPASGTTSFTVQVPDGNGIAVVPFSRTIGYDDNVLTLLNQNGTWIPFTYGTSFLFAEGEDGSYALSYNINHGTVVYHNGGIIYQDLNLQLLGTVCASNRFFYIRVANKNAVWMTGVPTTELMNLGNISNWLVSHDFSVRIPAVLVSSAYTNAFSPQHAYTTNDPMGTLNYGDNVWSTNAFDCIKSALPFSPEKRDPDFVRGDVP